MAACSPGWSIPTRGPEMSLSDSLQHAFLKVHQAVYERSGGRVGASIAGRKMLLLRTVGAKTGHPRTAALLYVRDGENYAVIASTGGGPKHPGWFHNLKARPEVEVQVGRQHVPVRARVAEDDERARIWDVANKVNGGQYDVYQSRTTRQIPVVVLEPR